MICSSAPVQGTAAFSKGIALMQLIADAPDAPTKAELVAQSQLPRQTTHRLLKALVAEQLVEETSNRRFRIGPRLFQFAGRAIEQNEIARRSELALEQLSQLTAETTHLAVRSGQQMVYLLKHDSPQALRLTTHVGGRVALHASSIGKSVLAFLPEEEREPLVQSLELQRITKFTVSSKAQLRRQLEAVRSIGYAVTEQESQLDVTCFGAPIFDHRQNPIAGVSISVPNFRLKSNTKRHYIQPLLHTCKEISRGLGGGVNSK